LNSNENNTQTSGILSQNSSIDLNSQSSFNESNKIPSNINTSYDTIQTERNNSSRDSIKSSFMENKSIPVSNIDEAVKLFDLTSQSPTSLYNNFDENSLISDNFNHSNYGHNTNLNTPYHDKNVSNATNDDFRLSNSLNELDSFNNYNSFGFGSSGEYRNSNKSLSVSDDLSRYSFYNDPLMMDIQSTSSSTTNSIASPHINNNEKFMDQTDSLLLSSSSNSNLPSKSSSLLVNSTTNRSLSLSLSLDVNSRNRSTSRFYSSITLPSDSSKKDLYNKNLLDESSSNSQEPISSSSSLSITIPNSEENDIMNPLNLPLNGYSSTYQSLIPTSTTDILSMSKEKIKEDKKNNDIYQAMAIDMNLPSTSNQYSSYISNELLTEENKLRMNGETSSSYIIPMDHDTNETDSGINASSNIPIKNVSSPVKNDELTDPQSSVSSNYLTPPLSPSLPTTAFVECQEQPYSTHKVYPCGLDTPCIDNCNCNECIANLPVSNIINHYTESIKGENRNNVATSSPSGSRINSSLNAMDINSSPHQPSTYKTKKNEEYTNSNDGNDDDGHKCDHCQSHHHYDYDSGYGCKCCHEHEHEHHNHSHSHSHCHDKNCEHDIKPNQDKEQIGDSIKSISNIVDKKMNYGEGDVIIEVGCSNVNCPKMDCPRRKFRPIASVCDGKICSTDNTAEILNEAPCSNYNPLYHLIAAAEIASRKIDKNSSNNCANCTRANDDSETSSSSSSLNCCKSYSTDIENCHLVLSSKSSPDSSSQNSHSSFKNYRSIKAKFNGQQHHPKSNLNQVYTASSGSSSEQNSSSKSIKNTNSTDPGRKMNSPSNIGDESKSRQSQSFKGIYIREDYNPNETSPSKIYESTDYSDLHAQKIKQEADQKEKLKNIQDYETLKTGLAASSTSIFSSSALNPSTLTASSTSLNNQIFRNNKLSWIPAPIHSQLEPTINPLLLKPNLYANVKLSSIQNNKELSDPVVDSCQVTILDKKQAIEQAIRCSQCPHSDRCYKRIRIEQLIN